jgi:crotonobetainyl-CoA hydratase
MAVVESERRDGVGLVILNRPEARNAVSDEVSRGVEAALDEFEADDDIRVVVLTGRGQTFCAGADLKMIAAGRGLEIATERGGFGGVTSRDFPKPLIAAVNGPALAGGLEIVLACDLAVASAGAMFGIPEVKRGLFAAAGGLIRLPHRLPLAAAMELALTGDPIPAERALALGLVNRVVPTERVLDETLALASTITANGPLAVGLTLRMVRAAKDLTEAEGWELNARLAREVFGSHDAIEGATAFAEKRPPRWTGT